MTETSNQQQTPQYPPPGYYYSMPQVANDEIDLRELFAIIWQGKYWIIAFAFVFGLIGGIYALIQPDIYESSALIAPADSDQSSQMAGLAGQFGGLASLAGINLGSQGTDKITLALQVLQSRKFIGDFIENHKIKPILMATTGWDKDTEKLEYDTELYNPETKEWLKTNSESLEPSKLKSTAYFLKKILVVEKETKTNITTVSIHFYSPVIAQQWVTWLIRDLNEEIRQQDMKEAQSNMQYLEQQIAQTSLADNRTMLFKLIEQQTKTLMLAKVRKEYAFKTIDPSYIPEKKSKPYRTLYLLVSVLLGVFLSTMSILIKHMYKEK